VQQLLWTIELQGDRIELKQHLSDYHLPPRPPRRNISTFSQRSRMRMLKFVAGVDWSKQMAGHFITLTYPDQVFLKRKCDRNIHRFVFNRHLERTWARNVSSLWRVEWKERLTGVYKGQMCPHMHLIVFGPGELGTERCRDLWQRTIGENTFTSVDVQPLGDAKKAGIYLSKYAAKLPDQHLLDKVSYLNTPGRHWGYTKRPGIPLQPLIRFVDLSWACVADLERMQRTYHDDYDCAKDAGFTMLGDRAKLWRDAVLQTCLADGKVPLYDDNTKGEQSSPIP
jgi:hypothetical protein